MDFINIISTTRQYNFHTHTQFCDGKNSIEEIAESAVKADLKYLGFTPHSPITCDSKCNMSQDSVQIYFDEIDKVKNTLEKSSDMKIFRSMEIDYLSRDFGPHIDYFQQLPLDYRLASVHFVPNQDGHPVDCDGRFSRFSGYLRDVFYNDLRYVVEKFYEQVLTMIELGGFDVLGHFDKIALNASYAQPGIEEENWYMALVEDVISKSESAGLIVEVNTKAFTEHKRLFPSEKWIPKLLERNIPLLINSDAHYCDRINSGRNEAYEIIDQYKNIKH